MTNPSGKDEDRPKRKVGNGKGKFRMPLVLPRTMFLIGSTPSWGRIGEKTGSLLRKGKGKKLW